MEIHFSHPLPHPTNFYTLTSDHTDCSSQKIASLCSCSSKQVFNIVVNLVVYKPALYYQTFIAITDCFRQEIPYYYFMGDCFRRIVASSKCYDYIRDNNFKFAAD